jgi:hypothetical protein
VWPESPRAGHNTEQGYELVWTCQVHAQRRRRLCPLEHTIASLGHFAVIDRCAVRRATFQKNKNSTYKVQRAAHGVRRIWYGKKARNRPEADDCLASAIRTFPAETRDGRRTARPISATLASRNPAMTRETTDPALVPPYQRERTALPALAAPWHRLNGPNLDRGRAQWEDHHKCD